MTLHLQQRKFTVREYALMGEAGVFEDGERVELIEGEIVVMSPHNRRHASRIARLTTLFVRLFGDTHEVRVQLPLTLGKLSEPEPDFALVPFEQADAAERHPGSADLVFEISDASLPKDRREKSSLYAKFQIKEYWILNLPKQRLEVRRQPEQNPKGPFGWDYASLTLLSPGQSCHPLFAPQLEFSVATLLGSPTDRK